MSVLTACNSTVDCVFNKYKSVYNSGYNCSRLVSDVLSQECNLIHKVLHNSPWDRCPSSKHVDQTVPWTVTRVYENATHSPEDCNLIHMVVHNTFPGTAALLQTILTKQSRGPLLGFARIPHTVPKTVTLFIWWQHTVSEVVDVV